MFTAGGASRNRDDHRLMATAGMTGSFLRLGIHFDPLDAMTTFALEVA